MPPKQALCYSYIPKLQSVQTKVHTIHYLKQLEVCQALCPTKILCFPLIHSFYPLIHKTKALLENKNHTKTSFYNQRTFTITQVSFFSKILRQKNLIFDLFAPKQKPKIYYAYSLQFCPQKVKFLTKFLTPKKTVIHTQIVEMLITCRVIHRVIHNFLHLKTPQKPQYMVV